VKEALDGNIFSFLLGLICTSNFLNKLVEQQPQERQTQQQRDIPTGVSTDMPKDMPSIIKFILRKIGKFGKRIMNHFINRLKKRSVCVDTNKKCEIDNYIKDLQKIFKEVEDEGDVNHKKKVYEAISEELIDYLLKNLILFLNSEARIDFTKCPNKNTIQIILKNNFFDDLYRTLFDTSLLWHLPLAAAEKLMFWGIKKFYCGQEYTKIVTTEEVFDEEGKEIYNEMNKTFKSVDINDNDKLPENVEDDTTAADGNNPVVTAANNIPIFLNFSSLNGESSTNDVTIATDVNPVVSTDATDATDATTSTTATTATTAAVNPVVTPANNDGNPVVNAVDPVDAIDGNAANPADAIDGNLGNGNPANNVKKNLNNPNESTAGGSRKLTKKSKTNKRKTNKRKTNKKPNKKLNKKLNNHKRVI
jgi:hypothetical protein